jgi:2-amino-4-ketopentanoate thiolase alpha subunit
MQDAGRCLKGEWVEIERVLLEPEDRSSALPPETASQPLVMWVKGFARADAAVGDEVAVETMTGRHVEGRLTCVNPGYFHTFGRPTPELTHVGRDLRVTLAEYRKAGGER